ncbi:hypothetical protein [Erwinia amylovora]
MNEDITPVSYTHLDVYKRQCIGCKLLTRSSLNEDITPVSYTHLDVYKRQSRYREARRVLSKTQSGFQSRELCEIEKKNRCLWQRFFLLPGLSSMLMSAYLSDNTRRLRLFCLQCSGVTRFKGIDKLQ